MATNLLEALQNSLGLNPVKKIDPNTQDVKSGTSHHFGQGAIPAVLLALYKYGNTERGSKAILRGNYSTDWLTEFFGDKKDEAIRKVADYAGEDVNVAGEQMGNIANEAVTLIRQQVPENASFETVKAFINEQRNPILKKLPAELQMGYLLNDNTIDDRTHKMEGPMSDNMHFFEKLFSGSTTEKNEKNL